MRAHRRQKLVLVMVGLPARGKSYVAQKLERYLNWNGYLTRIFNVGEYRRARFGAPASADFFSPENSEIHNAGEIWAQMMFEAYVALLKNPGARTFAEVRRDMAEHVVAASR